MTQPRDTSDAQAPTLPGRGFDARRKSLELRLEDGYQRIDQAAVTGADVTEWESFWIRLLCEYEDVCRESELAA